jgi:peptide/nickel transport system substrate-binding protein
MPDNPMGQMTMMRFNHLLRPFDNVNVRRVVLMVVNQVDFMTALAGDPRNWNVCASFFTCGGPMANDAGSEALTSKRDFARAKRSIAETGYSGGTIVVLDAVDQNNSHVPAMVTADLLKKLGFNVEVASADWAAILMRRESKKPASEGGWKCIRHRLGWRRRS